MSDVAPSSMTLLRDWSDWAIASRSLGENSVAQYRRVLVRLSADLTLDLIDVDEPMLVRWINETAGSVWNRNLRLKALRSFYGWAQRRGFIEENPTKELGIGRRLKSKPRGIAKPDLILILKAAGEMEDPRVGPVLTLLYYTGARIGSLAGCLREDVDLEAGEIWWRRAKAGKSYSSPLTGPALAAAIRLIELRDYVPTRGTRRPTLVGVGEERIRQWLHEACDLAHVKRVTPHQFRHSFATALATDPRVDIRTWVELMGHSGPAEFNRYAGASRTRMREALSHLDLEDLTGLE